MMLAESMPYASTGYTSMANLIGAGRNHGAAIELVATALLSDTPTDSAVCMVVRDYDGTYRAMGPPSDVYPKGNRFHVETIPALFTPVPMGVAS